MSIIVSMHILKEIQPKHHMQVTTQKIFFHLLHIFIPKVYIIRGVVMAVII